MPISCWDERGRLERVAVASAAGFHMTGPINAQQRREYPDQAIDVALLLEEHRNVIATLRQLKVEVIDVSPHSELPYLLNIRDAGVAVGTHLCLCRMALGIRAGEPFWVGGQLRSLLGEDLPTPSEGAVEGGDVFVFGPELAIGISERTTAAGAKAWGTACGAETVFQVHLQDSILHLDTAFNVVDDVAVFAPDLIQNTAELLDWLSARGIERRLEVSAEDALALATNFLQIAPGEIVIASSAERVTGALEQMGVQAHSVPMDEHHRIGGSVRCMTLPINRALVA